MDSPTCKPDMRLRHPNLERPVIPRYARKAGLGNLGKVFGTLAEFCSSLIPLSRSEPKSSFEKQAIGTRRRFFTDNQSQMDVVDEVVEMFSISTLQEGSKHVKSINPSVNSSFLSVTEDTSSATNSQKFEFAQVEEIYYEPLSVLHGLDDKPGQLWEFLRFMQSASTEQKSIYIQRKEAESTFQLVSMNPELRWSSAISSNSSTNINTIHEQDDDAPHELKRLESRFLKKRARRISSTEHEEEEDVTIIDLANESLDDLGITNGNATETQSNPTTAASSTSLASSSQSLLLEKQSCISENSFQRQVGKIDSDQDTNLSFKSTPSSISEDDDSFRSLRRAAIVVPGSKESSQSKKSQARPTRHSLFTSRRAWTFMSLNIPCPTQESSHVQSILPDFFKPSAATLDILIELVTWGEPRIAFAKMGPTSSFLFGSSQTHTRSSSEILMTESWKFRNPSHFRTDSSPETNSTQISELAMQELIDSYTDFLATFLTTFVSFTIPALLLIKLKERFNVPQDISNANQAYKEAVQMMVMKVLLVWVSKFPADLVPLTNEVIEFVDFVLEEVPSLRSLATHIRFHLLQAGRTQTLDNPISLPTSGQRSMTIDSKPKTEKTSRNLLVPPIPIKLPPPPVPVPPLPASQSLMSDPDVPPIPPRPDEVQSKFKLPPRKARDTPIMSEEDLIVKTDEVCETVHKQHSLDDNSTLSMRRGGVQAQNTVAFVHAALNRPCVPQSIRRPASMPKIRELLQPRLENVSPQILAQEITIVDHTLFMMIQPRELICKAWTGDIARKQFLAPNVVRFIEHFEQMTSWVKFAIVHPEQLNTRRKRLSLFIQTLQELRKLHNFNGMMAILAGIDSPAVYRLKQTRSKMPKSEKEYYQSAKELMASTQNHSRYKDIIARTSPPAMPFLGVHLTELNFLEDCRPHDVLQEDKVSKKSIRLINFTKRRETFHAINQIMRYQDVLYPFHHSNTDIGIKQLLEGQLCACIGLSESDLLQLSKEREPASHSDH